jgi:hypothetical protein
MDVRIGSLADPLAVLVDDNFEVFLGQGASLRKREYVKDRFRWVAKLNVSGSDDNRSIDQYRVSKHRIDMLGV